MFKENDECCAIQCEKCGGTMYSDAASTSFICSFCGNKEPWPNSENILDSEIKYRHKPVEVVNGLVKLGHVYFMEPLPEMLKNNTQSIEDKLGVFSALSTKVYEESHTIKLPCPLRCRCYRRIHADYFYLRILRSPSDAGGAEGRRLQQGPAHRRRLPQLPIHRPALQAH